MPLPNNDNKDIKKTNPGILIVIDGTDGSGKATQVQFLVERLRAANYAVVAADFPQYGKKSAGLVEEYLNGRYGTANEVGPWRASIFYAADRYDASFQIRQWLAEGNIVVANRYVTANLAHQGGKITDPEKRKKFFAWLEKLEYRTFAIPRPDLTIILHVDAALAQTLVDGKGERSYIDGQKRDIHEADLNHLRAAEAIYLEIARTMSQCLLIECARDGQIMAREEISELIWQAVKTHLLDGKNNDIQNKPLPPTNPNDGYDLPKKLWIQRLTPAAILPTRAHPSDAGLDLYAVNDWVLYPSDRVMISTGIKIALPDGYAGLIWDKSSLAAKGLHAMAGVIDADYRGEIKVVVINLSNNIINIGSGQKIAQLLIQKIETPDIRETDALPMTERGEGAFGSTGA